MSAYSPLLFPLAIVRLEVGHFPYPLRLFVEILRPPQRRDEFPFFPIHNPRQERQLN
jgi:hypothetical protein